jgi:hypothetical protein
MAEEAAEGRIVVPMWGLVLFFAIWMIIRSFGG